MIDAKARPFFMLDGTLEYQKEIVDKIASELPLESVAEYFERNGIKMAECQNDVEMKQRSNDFEKRHRNQGKIRVRYIGCKRLFPQFRINTGF